MDVNIDNLNRLNELIGVHFHRKHVLVVEPEKYIMVQHLWKQEFRCLWKWENSRHTRCIWQQKSRV